MGRVSRAFNVLLNREGGRNLTVFPDDIFLVSYPKSGNTWLRFLIGNLRNGGGVDFTNIESMVPDIYKKNNWELRRIKRPRILKSHELYDSRYNKVVYIVRDPRDVAVSYYYHRIKFGSLSKNCELGEFVQKFVVGNLAGAGTWAENVGSWIDRRDGTNGFILLRYEDLLDSTERCLVQIAGFLGLNVSDVEIEKAVDAAAFNRMKELEDDQSNSWDVLKSTDKTMSFVRAGKSGGWVNEFKNNENEIIEAAWHEIMKKLGYL